MIRQLIKGMGRSRPDGRGGGKGLPDGLRIYAIGDVHGRLDLLKPLIANIKDDAALSPCERQIIIYLGDYVDRGLQTKELIDYLLEGPPNGFDVLYLKGNHEEALLRFLGDSSFGGTWKYYGGMETLMSYGVGDLALKNDPEAYEAAREEFAELIPGTHLEFLRGLRPWAAYGDYFFVHAGVKPGVPLAAQKEDDLLWIREDFLDSRVDFGKIVVHGHTPTETPEVRPNRIGIDTGAYMTNRLTCLRLEADDRSFIQVDGPEAAAGTAEVTAAADQ